MGVSKRSLRVQEEDGSPSVLPVNTIKVSNGKMTDNGGGDVSLDTSGAAGSNHDILSATHSDTAASAVSRGSIIYGNSTPKWAELNIGAANRYLTSDGTDVSWAQVSATSGVTGTLPIANGGTGQTTQTAAFDALAPTTTAGDIIVHNGTDNIRLAVGSAGYVPVASSIATNKLAWMMQTPRTMLWHGKKLGDMTSTTAALISTTGSRYLIESGTTQWSIYDAWRSGCPWQRTAGSTSTGLTITPTVSCLVLDSGTEYILSFATGGTAPYRYSALGASETACSFSGTAVATGAQRIGYDFNTGYVYIMDGASRAATDVKRYTFSGTTLTYVDAVTLSAAPAATGSRVMFIGATNLCIFDDAANTTPDMHRYGKSSGTQADNPTWSASGSSDSHAECMIIHPNTKEGYLLCELDTGTTKALQGMYWSPDDPY